MTPLQPSLVIAGNENPPIGSFEFKVLAQGDSWFSIGALRPWSTTSFLMAIQGPASTCVVNCAHPGDELAHMCDAVDADEFVSLLAGNVEQKWDAILLSGGGNDLIDALRVPASDPSTGIPHSPAQRLLLSSSEWTADPAPLCYFSSTGWNTFDSYFRESLQKLIKLRNSSKLNATTPIHCHTYDYPTPRPAPAATWPVHVGPWLYPALTGFGIPSADWAALTKLFIDKLAEILLSYSDPLFIVHDTRGVLIAAAAGSVGLSNDWENEIHPAPGGYQKLAQRWPLS